MTDEMPIFGWQDLEQCIEVAGQCKTVQCMKGTGRRETGQCVMENGAE